MKQYSNTGGLTLSMLLVTLYQGFYVWDALYQEVSSFFFRIRLLHRFLQQALMEFYIGC